MLFPFFLKKKNFKKRAAIGEIIRFTWWTSDVVHHFTKKLPHV